MRKWVVVVVAAAVVAALTAVTTAQEEKKDGAIDEGTELSLKGELTKSGDRPALKVSDGEYKGKTFVVLENAKLEELEKWVKENKADQVEVSCSVTKYNGKNFLTISSFKKPGEKEEGEEEGEEEGDDE
jgi:hypothetical protein